MKTNIDIDIDKHLIKDHCTNMTMRCFLNKQNVKGLHEF